MRAAILGLFKPISPFPRLAGPTLVVGSGPGACLPVGYDRTWTLATVNGSQAIATRLGCGSPDLTLLGQAVLKDAPVNREAQAVLRGGRAGTLICIRDAKFYSPARTRLAALDYTFDHFCILKRADRMKIISTVLGEMVTSEQKPSNGVALAFLCLHLGASFVVMTGFSFSRAGHAYNDCNRPRGHTGEDMALLAMAVAKGVSIFTSQSDFALESGLPVYERPVGAVL